MANLYTIQIKNRLYTEWTIDKHFPELEPIREKMFNNDVFTVNSCGKITIEQSAIRTTLHIPGILVLHNGKTYGRKIIKGKLLYKVIPNDSHLPVFLVPYEIKQLGFSKVVTNLYVTITFSTWETEQKHPIGSLNQVIGPVNIVENFYEYQLYCKELNTSIQPFIRNATRSIQQSGALENTKEFMESIKKKYPGVEDRTTWKVFSIDPEGSKDFDDAFSIITSENSEFTQVSIYIANVVIWIEALGLWSSFSKRASTMYLPDKKRPMLPPLLSDVLCSLQEREIRIAFTMDVFISQDTSEIKDVRFVNSLVGLHKNYVYEEPSLLKNKDYENLAQITRRISKHSTYNYMSYIEDSHEVVAYWAIFMNASCAQKLLDKGLGIFRKTTPTHTDTPMLTKELEKIIPMWSNISGEYTTIVDPANMTHETLSLDCYIHITSPIRRIVDILNMIKFMELYEMIPLSSEACAFYESWTRESMLEYINKTTRNIKKVQSVCELLQSCMRASHSPEKVYDGYILEMDQERKKSVVYLPDFKFTANVKIMRPISLYEKIKLKIYIFNDEDTLKKKIRLQMV